MPPQDTLPEELRDRLTGVQTMLEADGYGLALEDEYAIGKPLALRIVAGPEACEDCLVGKEVMAMMISDQLGGTVPPSEISLRYPGE